MLKATNLDEIKAISEPEIREYIFSKREFDKKINQQDIKNLFS